MPRRYPDVLEVHPIRRQVLEWSRFASAILHGFKPTPLESLRTTCPTTIRTKAEKRKRKNRRKAVQAARRRNRSR